MSVRQVWYGSDGYEWDMTPRPPCDPFIHTASANRDGWDMDPPITRRELYAALDSHRKLMDDREAKAWAAIAEATAAAEKALAKKRSAPGISAKDAKLLTPPAHMYPHRKHQRTPAWAAATLKDRPELRNATMPTIDVVLPIDVVAALNTHAAQIDHMEHRIEVVRSHTDWDRDPYAIRLQLYLISIVVTATAVMLTLMLWARSM